MFILCTIFLLILAFFNVTVAQAPLSHQNWNSATISAGAITIDCAPLLLPIELGRVLAEPNPTVAPRGEMDKSLRSSHPVKVSLQPETGVVDDLTTINGCTTNGAKVQLATTDTGDTVTVKHTPGSIEFFGATDVVLSNRVQVLTLERKAGVWVSVGAVGGASGGGGTSILENLTTSCANGVVGTSTGAGQVDCGPSLVRQADCTSAIIMGQLCQDLDSGQWYRGDGVRAGQLAPFYATDCSPYAGIGQLCIDLDDGNIWRGNGEDAACASCASGGGGSQNINDVYAIGRVATGLNSEANAAILGNGTTGLKFFNSTIKCFDGVDTCDLVLSVPSGKNLRLQYNGTDFLVANLTGGVTLLNSGIEYKTYVFNAGMFSADGTNCTDPVERIINPTGDGPEMWTLNCGDNVASTFGGSVTLRDSYNGTPVFVLLEAVNENAAPTGVLRFNFEVMCRSDGDPIAGPWSTATPISITFASQYDLEQLWSAAITPNGTCAAGDKLFWRAKMDATATTTQVANTFVLSTKVRFATNRWSE